MARYDFSAHRLYVDAALAAGTSIALDRTQANYLGNVLRLADDAEILIFNGRDGEWRAALSTANRKSLSLTVKNLTRPQEAACDLIYIFAPLKHARLDYMVQKAVEMGVSLLQPVQTQHTQATRLNADRMRANVIEAAEQCGVLAIPDVAPMIALSRLLDTWPEDRSLIFCDEDAPIGDPAAALRVVQRQAGAPSPLAVLIGPEGGFDAQERERLVAMRQSIRLSLGPRILRADTAAVAALSLTQAILGDWCR
jgi:16S rRNA (uracil1498-N3)-methyltransferase